MAVPMPAAIVLIVCKTLALPYASQIDQENAAYTGHQPREWATEHSMMTCRRQEVELFDQAEAMGADPQSFNMQRCQRAAVRVGTEWDVGHRGSSYRFWRVACPVPIVRKNPDGTEDIIAWKMPECGHKDTVRCEVDTEI